MSGLVEVIARPQTARKPAVWAEAVVVLVASLIFLAGIISPPSLMDDMDAVQAQIARNMLNSGDWVTARLDGVPYLEKGPLKYWMIAGSYSIFGVHDWAARLPLAVTCIVLCWLVARIGRWAFSDRAGMWAGLAIGTSVGLWLFTRVMLTEAFLTLAITLAIYSILRALEPDALRPRLWSVLAAASMAIGLLFKGLTGVVFPAGAAFLYLLFTRRLLARDTWKRLCPFWSIAVFLAIAVPWHVLAVLRNPPYFDFTLHSQPGQYRGFFWFYFMNEHVLRYLNLRYPRDYNTVPRVQFWVLHLVWLFPWTAFLPALRRLEYRPVDRAGRVRLMALLWTGLVLVFFSFSTTQEYYTMPAYPAIALLIGSAIAAGSRWIGIGARAVSVISAVMAVTIVAILVAVWNTPAPGDISSALIRQAGEVYTLSLGHMQDLTLRSMAYVKLPIAIAGVACLIGAIGGWRRSLPALAVMMVVLLHGAWQALIAFDPHLSSRPLAEALNRAPEGRLIVDNQYYAFSSVMFYTNRTALLLNGRVNNLEYGSNAPGAPDVFLTDADLPALWKQPQRLYVAVERPSVPRIEKLVGKSSLYPVASAGGKYLFTNAPLH